jgi:hypothetical protein
MAEQFCGGSMRVSHKIRIVVLVVGFRDGEDKAILTLGWIIM